MTCTARAFYNAIAENDNLTARTATRFQWASVDIDPVDVTNMQTRPDIWTAAGHNRLDHGTARLVCVSLCWSWQTSTIRFFDPATGESGVDVVEVPGTAIKADALKSDSTVENLAHIAGETYGNLDYLSAADWMPKDLIHK